MRALILLLAAAVVALAVLIVMEKPPRYAVGAVFPAMNLISDAEQGERATYRDEDDNRITYVVEGKVPGGPDREPIIRVLVHYQDRHGQSLPGGAGSYDHLPTRHGLFPLMAPSDPGGYDRIWVWTRLRWSRTTWDGRPYDAWRFDLIDPALPSEGGADHVVAWIDPRVPVFGLLRWQRGGRTWELVKRGGGR